MQESLPLNFNDKTGYCLFIVMKVGICKPDTLQSKHFNLFSPSQMGKVQFSQSGLLPMNTFARLLFPTPVAPNITILGFARGSGLSI